MMRFPEKYRVNPSGLESRHSQHGDRHGAFLIPPRSIHRNPIGLRCLASSGDGDDWDEMASAGVVPKEGPRWEHVSISLQPGIVAPRCPIWEEMCIVKDLFWDAEDCVVQFHPPRSEYVNESAYCLHLWRPVGVAVLRPPPICVGVQRA